MRVKNLVVDRWEFKFTLDIKRQDRAHEKYLEYCELLYPDHEPTYNPTCDHCGQQHLRFVFWTQSTDLPGPNNWARIGSSCIHEWLIGKLKSGGFFLEDALAKIVRQLVMPDKLNNSLVLRNTGNNYWIMDWRRDGWLKPYLEGYSNAVYTKPWLVLGHKGNLTVKLVDDLPSYLSVFLEIAPQLAKESEVLVSLKKDGCLIETNYVFNELSATEALTSFKQRLYLYLLNDLRAVITQEGYSEWRSRRLMATANVLSHQIQKLEEAKRTPAMDVQLANTQKTLDGIFESLIAEISKDEDFTSWCSKQVLMMIAIQQQANFPHEKAEKILAELARREAAGEP